MSQRSLRLSSFLFILFCVFCSSVVISSILPSSSFILLAQLFCYWFLLVYLSFQLLCCSSLFACSLVLLGPCQTFLIFSWSMPPFYFWDFWIIFTIIIMNYFSGRLLISSSFIWSVCSCRSLLCSFVCKYSSVVSFLLMNGTVFLSCLFLAWGVQHWSLQAVGWSWSQCQKEDLWERLHWLMFPGSEVLLLVQ